MKPFSKAQNVSVIIPALNEAERIARLVRRLRAMPQVGEIIVCDGGSVDETVEIARLNGAQVLECVPNRGAQMNAGANFARGEILWFLHADSLPPRSGASRIVAACNRHLTRSSRHRVLDLRAKTIIGGNFRLRFEALRNNQPPAIVSYDQPQAGARGLDEALHSPRAPACGWLEALSFDLCKSSNNSQRVAARVFAHIARVLRSFGVYYGDSGIWMRRDVFEQIGGFKGWPLFEDYDMARRLERFARQNGFRTICIASPIVVSSRRFGTSARSATKLLLRWSKLQVLFWLGVAPDTLAKMYRKK